MLSYSTGQLVSSKLVDLAYEHHNLAFIICSTWYLGLKFRANLAFANPIVIFSVVIILCVDSRLNLCLNLCLKCF